ncbi:MAG: DUF4902 domain-containing protein [Gammaproteobacteria bacterium]|nr:DUF4902 domain-containing protein [Gammaproteobacteria bacterium]
MNRSTDQSWKQDSSAGINMLPVSIDGYIRLSFAKLQAVSLVHLISGLDENSPAVTPSAAIATEITGYTEWVNTSIPTITIGWDWQMNAAHNHILPRRINEPRSNIMLIDSTGRDIGPMKTMIMLEALIDELDWPIVVRNHIDIRYGK